MRAMGRDNFLYLNMAASALLLVWAAAYHLANVTQWRRGVMLPPAPSKRQTEDPPVAVSMHVITKH